MGWVTRGLLARIPHSPERCLTVHPASFFLEHSTWLPSLCCPSNLPPHIGFTQPPFLLQTFLVRKDSASKRLALCVHFPSLNASSSEVLEYTIKEEKSSKYPSFRSGLRPQQQDAAPLTTEPPPRARGV